jgi:excisionase family DNA binding protein
VLAQQRALKRAHWRAYDMALVNNPVTLQPIVPRLLTIKQAAIYLGAAVWAIRQAIWANDLKACKIGRRFVIPREELDAYIDRKIEERAQP